MVSEAEKVRKTIEEHRSAGRFLEVDKTEIFALDKGKGETVFCIHGVPTSSFLYRKVIHSLEKKGFRGIAVDLPGFGFSERADDFDYSFPGYADFLEKVLDEMRLEKVHLVVHDIGGPIGFALAAKNQKRISSLTILNTWIDVVNFEKPFIMRPFEKNGIDKVELKMMSYFTWPAMFRNVGILDKDGVPSEEINAHLDLLKQKDGGAAFLKLMKNFSDSPAFRDLCYKAVQDVDYPVQAIWGKNDPLLTKERYGEEIKRIANLKEITLLPARHFLQEEVWLEIADKIDELILSANIQKSKI